MVRLAYPRPRRVLRRLNINSASGFPTPEGRFVSANWRDAGILCRCVRAPEPAQAKSNFIWRDELQSLNRKSGRAGQSITCLANLLQRRDDKIESSLLHFLDHLKFCAASQFFSKNGRTARMVVFQIKP